MEKYWELAIAAIAAVGGWQFVRYVLNLNANRRISAAEAFKEEYKAVIEDYKRVQGEVDKLNALVDDLYKRVHALESERLDLIKENNELKLALKEAEKHVCLQPDDKCLRRLNNDIKCRLVGLLRGAYTEDHPGAILTEEDMKGGADDVKGDGIPEEPRQG